MFGEHAVVYGRPAVACSLPDGAYAALSHTDSPSWTVRHPEGTLPVDDDIERAGRKLFDEFDLQPEQLQIDVELSIPVGVGLGSSAAMAVALAKAAAELTGGGTDGDAIERAVAASETVFHATPSGIDQRAAAGRGFFSYKKCDDSGEVLSFDVPSRTWVVARVGPSKSTAEMVKHVADRRERNSAVVDSVFDDFAAIAEAGRRALGAGNWDAVGELMDLNHGLLNALGASTPRLEAAVDAARTAGALGAKLTGAGGGGCIAALPAPKHLDDVAEALDDHGDVHRFELPA